MFQGTECITMSRQQEVFNLMKKLFRLILAFQFLALCGFSAAQSQLVQDYVLGQGDVVRITVFQNPDLTTDARVSESGSITFPLVGAVAVGGLTQQAAEQKIARLLTEGGFVVQPQVNMLVMQVRGSQVAVLGQVNRPGRYPLETNNTRLIDMLALAGGVSAIGADAVVVAGVREGKPFRREVDIAAMYLNGNLGDDILLAGGDSIYVQRAPVFYIYGEVQRPGAFRLERDMTVMQALATGGGLTPRGTQRGLQVHRRGADGKVQILESGLQQLVQPDDVVYVKESIF